MGSEFLTATGEKKPAPAPYDRAKLVAEIEKLRPQIDIYRSRIDAIDADHEKAFMAVLKPQQLAVYEERAEKMKKDRAERDAKLAGLPVVPLSDEEIAKLKKQ